MDIHDKARSEGATARVAGLPFTACPYEHCSTLYYDWACGWQEARERALEAMQELSDEMVAQGRAPIVPEFKPKNEIET